MSERQPGKGTRRMPRAGVRTGLAVLLAAWVRVALPAEGLVSADAVKAAFLFRFGEYVEWPAPASPAPLVIAVLRAPVVAGDLRRIAQGRTLQNRPVTVREIASAEQMADADILFVGAGSSVRRVAAVAARNAHPVLIVADAADGLAAGAAINFVEREHRVRFEVSPGATALRGIKLSSRLLGVAVRIVAAQ